jgi:hypothetical protein
MIHGYVSKLDMSPVLYTFYAIYDGSIVFKLETVELPQINIDVLMTVYVGMKIGAYIIVIYKRPHTETA